MGGLGRGEAGGWNEVLWVGIGWVDGEIEENEAVGMRCWTLWVGGRTYLFLLLLLFSLRFFLLLLLSGWVGGWVGRTSSFFSFSLTLTSSSFFFFWVAVASLSLAACANRASLSML